MVRETKKVFGGGCHWCTEAVFQSLKGVDKVEQGFVASTGINSTFSEAVIIYFNAKEINLKKLVEIHLHTHKSKSNHSMRKKYRSAIYVFSESQRTSIHSFINLLQPQFNNKIITQILDFNEFKPSLEQFQDYYKKNPRKPFCEKFIHPKLKLLQQQFSKELKTTTLSYI